MEIQRIQRVPSPTFVKKNSRCPFPKLLKWQHPAPGFAAVNCDGSFRDYDETGGYGVIIRDGSGEFVAAKAKHFHRTDLLENGTGKRKYGTTVLMIEMMAILDGLRLAKDRKLTHLEIQSDSKVAISILHGRTACPSPCLFVYLQIMYEASFFAAISFFFVYRETNGAADFLSKLLRSDGEQYMDASSQLHRQLQNIITEDRLGVVRLRF